MLFSVCVAVAGDWPVVVVVEVVVGIVLQISLSALRNPLLVPRGGSDFTLVGGADVFGRLLIADAAPP
jgi:hypothetical protein